MKELEQYALDFLRNSGECIYLISCPGNQSCILVDANEVFEELFGESAVRCKGNNIESFTDYATAKRLEAACKKSLIAKDIHQEQILVSTVSGLQNHHCTFTPLTSHSGEPLLLCIHRFMCNDLAVQTQNIQYAKFLNQSETVAFMGHFVVYPDKKCVVLSDSLQNLLGLNRREISFKEASSMILKEEFEYLTAQYHSAIKEKTVFFARHTIVEPSGRKRQVISRGDFVYDSKQNIQQFWCQIQELTYTNELRNEVRSIQTRMRALTSKAPFGYIVLNGSVPVFVNKTLFEWTDTSYSHNLNSINPLAWVHPNDRKSLLKLIKKLIRKESHETYMLTVRSNATFEHMHTYDLFVVVLPYGDDYQTNILIVDVTEDLEKEKYKHQLAFSSMLTIQKNEDMQEARRLIESLISEKKFNRADFAKILHTLEMHSNNELDWSLFNNHIENLCPDFVNNLRTIYPALSASDIKHCACIRLNFDTKETASFFHVTPTSIQTARVRLKKKMGLSDKIDLRDFIFNI